MGFFYFLLASSVLIWILLTGDLFKQQSDVLFSPGICRFCLFVLLLCSFPSLGEIIFICPAPLVFLLEAEDLFFTSSGELQPWSFQLYLLLSAVSSSVVTFSHLLGCVLLLFMLPVYVFPAFLWLSARIWVTSSVFSSSSTILFSAESNWPFHTSPELCLFPRLYFFI